MAEPTGNTIAVEVTEEANRATPRKGRRISLLVVVVSAVVVAALLGGGVWWFLQRGQAGGGRDLPKDAVALINSITPLPTTIASATGPKDAPGSVQYAPESETWSPALKEAKRALDEGRYSAAVSQYAALVGSPSTSEALDALWGLADAYWRSGQADLALRAYTILSGLDDPRSVRAFAMMAHIQEQAGSEPEAVVNYNNYLKRAGPAGHALMLMKARLMGATQDAEDVYKAVLDDKPSDVDARDALLAWADVKSRRGDHKGARDLYDRLAALQTANPRPLLDNYGTPPYVLAAEEARAAGDTADAKRRLLAYLKGDCGTGSGNGTTKCPSYPYGQYSAVAGLLKIEPSAVVSGTVDAMQAARLAYASGYFDSAVGYMNTLRQNSPTSAALAEASLLTGKAYEAGGDSATAYNWYTNTVQTYPTSPQAPEAARRAGDTLRDQSQWDNAMLAYHQAAQAYPTAGAETMLARINGGVLAYRLEHRDEALDLLNGAVAMGEISPTLKAQAAFWVGKIQKGTGSAAWKASMGQAQTGLPGTFYGFRAAALLNGEGDGGPLVLSLKDSGVTADELGVRYADEASERAALLTWAAGLSSSAKPSSTPSTTAADGIQSPLKDDPELQRAVSLLDMGFDGEAFVAFRVLGERLQIKGDALSLAQLVIYLRYHATANTAMRVSEQLAAMDKGDATKQPTLLLKTLYPTPYKELVMEQANLRDLDPLVMYALMRQESQFRPDALSGADARGLAQVIPSTGEGIARQLGVTGYQASDLYLPHVAIRFGTYYLAQNLPTFDRKLLPTLAAYNAGPGNASEWLAGSALIDPDLYIERINLFETEDYLRRVYQNYGFYKLLYAP